MVSWGVNDAQGRQGSEWRSSKKTSPSPLTPNHSNSLQREREKKTNFSGHRWDFTQSLIGVHKKKKKLEEAYCKLMSALKFQYLKKKILVHIYYSKSSFLLSVNVRASGCIHPASLLAGIQPEKNKAARVIYKMLWERSHKQKPLWRWKEGSTFHWENTLMPRAIKWFLTSTDMIVKLLCWRFEKN